MFDYKRIILSKEEQAKSDKNWDNIDWSDNGKQTADTNIQSAEVEDVE